MTTSKRNKYDGDTPDVRNREAGKEPFTTGRPANYAANFCGGGGTRIRIRVANTTTRFENSP